MGVGAGHFHELDHRNTMSNIQPSGGQLLSVAGMAEGALFLGGGGGGASVIQRRWLAVNSGQPTLSWECWHCKACARAAFQTQLVTLSLKLLLKFVWYRDLVPSLLEHLPSDAMKKYIASMQLPLVLSAVCFLVNGGFVSLSCPTFIENLSL